MDMIFQLRRRHLVSRTEDREGNGTLQIHRALQWSILHAFVDDPEERQSTFSSAFFLVRRIMPDKDQLGIYSYDDHPTIEEAIPQILSLCQSGVQPRPALDISPSVAELYSQAGVFLWEQGYSRDCRSLAERGETILDQLGTPDQSPERADILTVLAILCGDVGVSRRTEHLQRAQKALELRLQVEKTVAPVPQDTEIATWCAWADLACAYLEAEEFHEVESIMEKYKVHCGTWKCTKADESWYWSRYYHHVSYVKMSQGKSVEAVVMSKRAVDLLEEAIGKTSSLTQMYRFSLAHLLYHAGDEVQSLNLFKIVYEDCQRLFGDYNLTTMTSAFATGALWWINGNTIEAEYVILPRPMIVTNGLPDAS
jgi:hypothetical protein